MELKVHQLHHNASRNPGNSNFAGSAPEPARPRGPSNVDMRPVSRITCHASLSVVLPLRLRLARIMVGSMNRAAVLSLTLACGIEWTADSGRSAESKEKGVVTTKSVATSHS